MRHISSIEEIQVPFWRIYHQLGKEGGGYRLGMLIGLSLSSVMVVSLAVSLYVLSASIRRHRSSSVPDRDLSIFLPSDDIEADFTGLESDAETFPKPTPAVLTIPGSSSQTGVLGSGLRSPRGKIGLHLRTPSKSEFFSAVGLNSLASPKCSGGERDTERNKEKQKESDDVGDEEKRRHEHGE